MNPSQEYEIMSKESPPCLTRVASSQIASPSEALCSKASPLPSRTLVASLSAEHTAGVETLTPLTAVRRKHGEEVTVAEQRDSTERNLLCGDAERGIRAAEDQEEAAQVRGRYEYMDIRRSDSTEGEDSACERRGSQTSADKAAVTQETDPTVEVFKTEREEEEEEERSHHTNKQPPHQENLSGVVVPTPDALTAGGEEAEEYEEMTTFGVVPRGWEQADYQNLPVKGRAVSEEVGGGRCAGIGGYIKVCAGMGEPGSNTSFDNPDYWHSRLFLNPDAVRT